ncbi:flippase [Halobacterium zhouii]|uniref:flippase n=1 Tax=Halobacterium zhouii TaxID=2902624 RepID=UPI001E62F503|nr:flippase [Halobacterium zhouii]
MSLSDRVSRGLRAELAGQAVSMGAKAGLMVLLARYLLTPAEWGLLQFALPIVGVLAVFGTLGLPKSAARYVTEYAERDPGQIPHVVGQTLRYLVALVAVVGGALAVGADALANWLNTPAVAPFLLVGVGYVAFRSFSNLTGLLFQGFNRVDYKAVVTVTTAVVQLLAAVGLVLAGYGALGAFVGYVAGFAVAAVVGLVILRRRVLANIEAADEVDADLTRRLLEYSVPLTATRGANVLDKKVDAILVGVLLNVTAVGYYALAKQVADFVSMPATAFGFTISPAIGEQSAGRRDDRAASIYQESLRHLLLLYVPACSGIVLVAEPMVRYVFGSAYLPAVPVVQVFAGYVLLDAVNQMTSDTLDYLGRARSRAVVKSVMAVSNFVLTLALVPVLGVLGAAVATIVTYATYTVANVRVIHDELGLDGVRLCTDLAVACLVSVGMAVVVLVSLPLVSGVLTLFAVVGVGFGAWAVLGTASGLLDVRRVVGVLR